MILGHAAALKPKDPSVHYQKFIALSRLKRKAEADRELAVFKQLDEARQNQPRQVDDSELENVDPSSAPPPT